MDSAPGRRRDELGEDEVYEALRKVLQAEFDATDSEPTPFAQQRGHLERTP